jgi:predicted signal transduction protein with EAL and GGDEF domain
VVAGGVETKAQLSFVREAGCDSLQGYLISPPLDGDGMTAWLGNASKAASQGAKSTDASRRRSSRRRSAPK